MEKYSMKDMTSWEVLSENIAIKPTDLSALKYNEIRISNEVKDFFSIKNMEKHERREINLIYEGTSYQCIVYLDSYLNGRGKLRWGKNFRNVFRDLISGYFFEENLVYVPLMRFHKIDSLNYEINFIFVNEIIEESKNFDEININDEDRKKVLEESSFWKIESHKLHGTCCSICGFNYVSTYGDIGKGKCKVLYKGDNLEEDVIKTTIDLVPICDNCKNLINTGHTYSELKYTYNMHKTLKVKEKNIKSKNLK